MEIEKILKEVGLDENEAKIYLASLALGESTVLPIADKAIIGRTYCYDILDGLAEKGLITHVEKRGRRRYSAVAPEMIKKLLADKISKFDGILPDLKALYQKSAIRPKVRFFEGKEGIDIIHQEILDEAKEIWFVGSISDWARKFPDYVEIVKKQIAKGIKIRDLVKHGEKEPFAYQKLYKSGLQEMRILPSAAQFNTDNMLWSNKLVMVSYGADTYAVSVESAEIAQTMRVIYEILWKKAKKI